MGFISDSLNRIQPSATIAISNKALAMQAEGQNVIGLAAGEHPGTPGNVAMIAKMAMSAAKHVNKAQNQCKRPASAVAAMPPTI